MSSPFLQIAEALLLFFGQNLGLGWWLARRHKGPLNEQLWLAMIAGIAVSGAWVFACYAAHLPILLHGAPTVLGLVGLLPALRRMRSQEMRANDRALIGAWGALTLVVLAALALVRNHVGGAWTGDWLEHLQRAQVFALHAPPDTPLLGVYTLPARPPLWNAFVAQTMGLLGPTFITTQTITALGATLVLAPAWWLVRRFGGGVGTGWLVALLIALNASFLQNATFAWTKLPAAALILGGFVFFKSARTLAFALLAVAALVHYSALPFILLLAAWHLVERRRAWRELANWRELGRISLVGTAILLPWFGWTAQVFGARAAATATTTVTDAGSWELGYQSSKIAGNLWDTIVPWFLRRPWSTWQAKLETVTANLHDMSFNLYQTNLWFAVGSVAALLLLADGWRHRRCRPLDLGFWLTVWVGGTVLGVAVHGEREAWGLAHICLQPLFYVALAAVAARAPRWSRLGQVFALIGLGLDFALGSALHMNLQSAGMMHDFTNLSRQDFFGLHGIAAHVNLYLKSSSLVPFLGDQLAAWRLAAISIYVAAVGTMVFQAVRELRREGKARS